MNPPVEKQKAEPVPFELARTGKAYVMGIFHAKGGTKHAAKVDGANTKFYWPFCGAIRHGSTEDWTSLDLVRSDTSFCKKCRAAIDQRCNVFGEVSLSTFMTTLHVGLVAGLGPHVPGLGLSSLKLAYDISREQFLLSCVPGEWSDQKTMNGVREGICNRYRAFEINGFFGVYSEPDPARDLLVVQSTVESIVERTVPGLLDKIRNRGCATI